MICQQLSETTGCLFKSFSTFEIRHKCAKKNNNTSQKQRRDKNEKNCVHPPITLNLWLEKKSSFNDKVETCENHLTSFQNFRRIRFLVEKVALFFSFIRHRQKKPSTNRNLGIHQSVKTQRHCPISEKKMWCVELKQCDFCTGITYQTYSHLSGQFCLLSTFSFFRTFYHHVSTKSV